MTDAISYKEKEYKGLAKFLKEEVDRAEKDRNLGTKVKRLRGAKEVPDRLIKMQKFEHASEEELKDVKKLSNEELRKVWSKITKHTIVFVNVKDLLTIKTIPKMDITIRDQERLGEDIKEKGVLLPLLITKNNEIIDGRNRYIMAKKVGIEKVPCIIVDDLDDNQKLDLFININLCRRQMTIEDQEKAVAQIKCLATGRRRGRPTKDEKGLISHRDLAKKLHISHEKAKELWEKDEPKWGGSKPKIEWAENEKKFRITFGKSESWDKQFLGTILETIKEIYKNLDKKKGSIFELDLIYRIGEYVEN